MVEPNEQAEAIIPKINPAFTPHRLPQSKPYATIPCIVLNKIIAIDIGCNTGPLNLIP